MAGDIKGQGFNTICEILREQLDPAQLAALRQSLQAPTIQAIDNPPMAMAWLQAEVHFDLLGALERLWQKKSEQVVALGEERMRRDLSRVYRVLMRFLPAQTVLAKVPTIWQTYARGIGELSVEPAGKTGARATYRDIALANPGWWLFQRGVISGTLQTTGAKNVQTHIVSGGGSEPEAVIEIRWS